MRKILSNPCISWYRRTVESERRSNTNKISPPQIIDYIVNIPKCHQFRCCWVEFPIRYESPKTISSVTRTPIYIYHAHSVYVLVVSLKYLLNFVFNFSLRSAARLRSLLLFFTSRAKGQTTNFERREFKILRKIIKTSSPWFTSPSQNYTLRVLKRLIINRAQPMCLFIDYKSVKKLYRNNYLTVVLYKYSCIAFISNEKLLLKYH